MAAGPGWLKDLGRPPANASEIGDKVRNAMTPPKENALAAAVRAASSRDADLHILNKDENHWDR
ncbi:hypothetical protein ABZ319_18985 [Nocardia sp. NPDC005978]|uniref:hypothetical protein n=1 Tax=Nocardia sp. NPDC005978 TaxID=3156725 RepID=UPI0033AE833B